MQNTNPKNNNGPHPWTWFTDKILPPLIVALCLSVAGGMYGIYQKIDVFGQSLAVQQRDIEQMRYEMTKLEDRISRVETNAVTRSEILETMKRIEQQMRIAMLESGIKLPKEAWQQ